MVATLPELLPEEFSQKLIMSGVVPIFGIEEAISAAEAAAIKPPKSIKPILKTFKLKEDSINPRGES